MTRASMKYLLVGILVGALAGGVFTAAAATTSTTKSTSAGTQATAAAKKAKPKAKTTMRCHMAKRHGKRVRVCFKVKAKKKAKKKAPVTPAPAAGETLTGLFKLTPGTFNSASGAAGSYVRLIMPGGSPDKGPYFSNPSSKGGTYTLLAPGDDGGLLTGSFQEPPAKPFSVTGDALARRLIAPMRFAGVLFSALTSPKDPQTGITVPAPSIVNSNGTLSGQVQALSAAWNNAFFNQGSPKPDGSSPGLTAPVRGTYDAATHAYTLDWSSSVVGGPFNGFTGVWHFEGTFEARCAAPAPAAA